MGKHQYPWTGPILEEKYEQRRQAYSQRSSISADHCWSLWRVRIMDGRLLNLLPALSAPPPASSSGSGPQRQHVASVWRESHHEEKTRKGGMEKGTMHISERKDILIACIQNRKGNIPHHCFPYIPLSLSHPSWLLGPSALEPQLPDKKEAELHPRIPPQLIWTFLVVRSNQLLCWQPQHSTSDGRRCSFSLPNAFKRKW